MMGIEVCLLVYIAFSASGIQANYFGKRDLEDIRGGRNTYNHTLRIIKQSNILSLPIVIPPEKIEGICPKKMRVVLLDLDKNI